jgi:hypothetical protein
MVSRIRDEGFRNSKVMDTLAHLTDVIGPRLTGSPQMKRANEWTREQLESWGLVNAHLESWGPFGLGWSFEHVAVRMVAPQTVPLIVIPKAWTPGTEGPVRGKVTRVQVEAEADLEKYKGKLAGAVVLYGDPREIRGADTALLRRYTDPELDDLARFQIPAARPSPTPERAAAGRRFRLGRVINKFLEEEKVLALIEPSGRDNGIVRVMGGGSRQKDEPRGAPQLVMAAEQYNRIARLLERKVEVELEIDVRAKFHEDDPMAYNTVAEVPGTDKKGEIVMVGAHMDSWHSGTGATDNGAGTAVAMEAVRILRALGVKPRRTIRVALWSGEEQGLLGSRAYVSQHFASRPQPAQPGPEFEGPPSRGPSGPLTIKPDHAKLSAYFNLDNGTGKIRGIYLQGNAAAAPIFEAWLKPFADLGARTVTMRSTGGTDHLSFDAVGLPGFQFIQDQADYSTVTHHTNIDVYDRIQREDMMQASVVMASFLYHAAMRPELIPRKPLPPDTPTPASGPSPPASPAARP